MLIKKITKEEEDGECFLDIVSADLTRNCLPDQKRNLMNISWASIFDWHIPITLLSKVWDDDTDVLLHWYLVFHRYFHETL